MNKSNWRWFRKTETFLLGILLYGIVMVYTYQYLRIANKYQAWTTDEFFYYTEAKAISAHNIYQTPASLDGNTSYIGDFGFHGISYAIKDGWLSKLFFHAQDPPLVFINFLTFIAILALILLFKPFSLNIRIKIALVVATHYILFSWTLSYLQETIQYFFAVLALRFLYHLYEQGYTKNFNYLYYYLIIIITAITFRYGWFLWGLGLLPLATNLKSFAKWSLVCIGLLAFGIIITRYLIAPYPYDEVVAYRIMQPENFSIMNSISLVWNEFKKNLGLFLTPTERPGTTCMRYLLLALMMTNSYYAIAKRNKFTIACTFISWGYFFAAVGFYHVYWGYDERALAVLNPLLAFSLITNCNSLIFYPIIAVQLWLFPLIIKTTKERIEGSIAVNAPTPERISKETTYSKIKDLVKDDHAVVIALNMGFVLHASPNYFVNFPLVNSKGYPIHYKIFRDGKDLRGTHQAQYIIATQNCDQGNIKLIYSDMWMYFYKVNF